MTSRTYVRRRQWLKLAIPELVENRRRSIAMLPPVAPALNRDEALEVQHLHGLATVRGVPSPVFGPVELRLPRTMRARIALANSPTRKREDAESTSVLRSCCLIVPWRSVGDVDRVV
jgi:hypothetical protein